MTQGEFFSLVINILKDLEIPYMITGSVAAIAYGEPRLTLDIDIVVDCSPEKAEKLIQRLDEDVYKDLESILEALKQRGHFNIIHMPSSSKVDFYQVKNDQMSLEMFNNRQEEAFCENEMAFFSKPEDVIINKLIYYKEGQSEKHLRDIQGMLAISGDRFDLSCIGKKVKELELDDGWEKSQRA